MSTFEPIPFVPKKPRPLLSEIAKPQPYPVAQLGGLRRVVEEVQAVTQAPIAMCSASALSVVSLAVNGHADVESLGGKRPATLYVLTIARSGERKSSVDERFMAPLRDFEERQLHTHLAATGTWKNDYALWKGQHEQILVKARKNRGENLEGAKAELSALGAEPRRPPSPERLVTEPTFEGLTKLFEVAQPSLGLFSDEGGQFLGGHAMGRDHRQKTLAAFNDLWAGKPIRRTRAADGHTTLFGRRLTMHLMVQPEVARTFLSDTMTADIGFVARLLISEPVKWSQLFGQFCSFAKVYQV